MAIEIVKTFVVKAPPATVWGFLTDPQRVARCMPGAAITDRIDDKTFAGTMAVKVGPVSTSYKGKIVFERLDPGARTAEIVATGQDVRGRGGADLRLTSSIKEVAPGETEVTAASKVNITGILAQMGRGMVQDVSDQLFQTFSQRMRAELEPASGAPGASAAGGAASETPASGKPASSAPAASATTAAPARGEALDLGSLGAKVAGRAAGRAVRRPAFWIVVIAVAGLLYLLFR
ncbi:MAG TPA: SRPBCC family protein [Myxococcales bacterium]|nr:SRPBCC family protein [Myxococcales bacterium]